TGVLNTISDNINTVAAAAGALAAIGGARFLGGMFGDLSGQTAQLIDARKNEIALAAARASSATQSQRKAAADAIAAERAYQLSQMELELTRNTNAEATATQNVIAKRRAMITANAALVQSNRAVTASQQALNSATSVMGLVKSGATGLLSLVGGLPGILMLGAGAWYTMYQNQEQARQSAREYANQIDEIKEKTSKMSLPELDSNRSQTVAALEEQKRLLTEQEKSVDSLNHRLKELNETRNNPALNQQNDLNIVRAIAIVTDQIAVEEEKLAQLREKSRSVSQALEDNERRRNDLIKERAWRQNAEYQSLVNMNGQHTEFNRLLGLGNDLLRARQGLANIPLRITQTELTSKQSDALAKSRRELELSRLQGEAKERVRLGYTADDLGLTNDPQYQTSRQELINNGLAEWRNNQVNKPKAKGGKTEAEKTADTYDKLIKQQKEQIALAGQNTELAKLKYQVSQGEMATLTETQKQILLQNAALIDQQKIREQLAAYEANLADSNASARASNQAELTGYGQGSRMRERMQEMLRIREEFQQKNVDLQRQYQSGDISEDLYRQELALNKRYLDERLRDQEAYYSASDAQRSDWTTGMREGFANWADTASDYASQSADLVNNAMSGLVGNISDALAGNKVDWEDWASSVLQSMQKIILNAMLVDSLRSASNSGFFSSIGGIFGAGAGAASGSTPSGAYNSAASGIKLNAKGGAYASESLSAYSNSIVSTPTYFAFAKGAGLMGEAGPEAIMPLTRSADGSLGVRMVGSQPAATGNGEIHITQHFNISGNGDAALKQAMQEAARQGANDGAKQARQDILQDFSNRGQARRLLGV
ncbi:TPA: phage tail tape measure protein, partial [Salmonella enterica]|nr:phage tail tape measure protein [Salmonella enterica subsp. enterica serovar Bonariensis]HCL4826469.1 phage tail tape measure protein [Salmonella enterica]